MFLQLSQDPKKAASIFSRYFRPTTKEFIIVDKSAVGLKCVSLRERKRGKASAIVLASPKLEMTSLNGSLILTTHPKLGEGEMRIITPDRRVAEEGFMLSVVVNMSEEEIKSLPYHFRVSILLHGFRS